MKLSMVEQGKKLEDVVELSRYYNRIRKSLWRIALVVLVTAGIAYPLIHMIKSKYVATSVVLIKALQEDTAPIPQMSRYDSTRSDYYETQYTIAGSRVVLLKAIQALGLDKDPTFNGGVPLEQCTDDNAGTRLDATLKNVANAVTVSGVRNTQLIDFSFESPSAEVAARVANGVAQAYIDHSVDQKRQSLERAQRWNQQQMNNLRQQMDAQKAEIDAYLKKEGLLTFRGVDGYETEQLGIVTNRLADATQRRIAAQSQYDLVQQALAKHSLDDIISIPDFSGHAQIQDLRIALTQTTRNLSELRKRYGPRHEKILEAQAEVGAVNRQIGQVLGELSRGAKQQFQAAQDDENRYKAMLDSQKGNFVQLASKRDKYDSMMTALNKTQDLYQAIYQRAHEQAMAVSMDQADAIISDPAAIPVRPAKPNKALLLIIAVVLVTLVYLVYLIITTAMDNRLFSISQMSRRLGLTALGEIPQFSGDPGRTALLKQLFSTPLHADIIHSIRTNLLLVDDAPQVVVVASAESGEGRSLVSHALAMSLSADQSTLLIDLDYVNDNGPGGDNTAGLAEVIQGKKTLDEVLISREQHLTILPRGKLSGSTFLMLTSRQMADLMATLRKRFTRIVIDVPAYSQSQDGQLIGREADAVVLVIQADHTQAPVILNMLKGLKENQNLVVGAVLNQVAQANLESKEGIRLMSNQLSQLNIPGKKS